MQITVQKSDLLTVLKRASASIATGDAVAYKSCVLVHAELRGIHVSSTDDVTSVHSTLPGGAPKLGKALLPHRRLSAIIEQLPEGDCEISVSPKLQVSIRNTARARPKFTMQALDSELFPKVAQTSPGERLCSFESKAFQQAAGDALLAVDEAYIFGALLVPEAERFRLVSIDSRELVVSSGDLITRDGTEPVIIPQRLMTAVKLLPATNTPVGLHVTEHKVSLVTQDTTIACNRLAHQFPEVWTMILDGAPKEKRFRVSAEAFLNSVRAVSVAAEVLEGDSRIIQIDIAYQDGTCLISTRESETNRGEDELTVSEAAPGGCLIYLNSNVLAPALRSFGPEQVDVYYGQVEGGGEALFLKSDTLVISITPIRSVGK